VRFHRRTGVPAERKPLLDDGRFWVYKDGPLNSWSPANWMPAAAAKMIELDPACTDSPKDGKTCMKVKISNWQDPYWCGVAFAVPDPNDPNGAYWGKGPAKGWDLRGAKRVVFWARAPKPCAVQFKAMIMGDQTFGDSAKFPAQTDYLELTDKWKEYSIAIDANVQNVSRVVSAFAFVTRGMLSPRRIRPSSSRSMRSIGTLARPPASPWPRRPQIGSTSTATRTRTAGSPAAGCPKRPPR